ncbi:MAG TPA: hypothetical protein VFH19_01305 [Nitrososphaeraceae archaeon]|nr:hypothetical protein [Nitrososphaeraceae archaeon]
MTQLSKRQSLQYPLQIKPITDREIKEYYLKKHYQLSLKSIGEIPQLVEPTDEQKEWVLHRLKQPVEYWQRWFVGQYFTQEQKAAMGLTDKDIAGRGIK